MPFTIPVKTGCYVSVNLLVTCKTTLYSISINDNFAQVEKQAGSARNRKVVTLTSRSRRSQAIISSGMDL